MYSILIRRTGSDSDDLTTLLWEFGTLGLIEEPNAFRAFFGSLDQVNAAATALASICIETRQETPVPESIVNDDWDQVLIGQRFFIAPSGSDREVPLGRMRLTPNTEAAFGSGRHESTQLLIEALERYVQPGATIVDVGCGSGILAGAARLLGAGHVFACDIDPNAIRAARETSGIALFSGSADAVRTGCADITLANITSRVVDALAPDLHRITRPEGRILIAGFTRDQLPRRFHPEIELERSDWQCWICKRDPLLAEEPAPSMRHPLNWWY